MPDGLLNLLPRRTALPRGRSALPESEVAESRRGRILQAVVEEVAERGYGPTTVAGITRRARVSRTAFYEAFADKEEAFAAAHLNASELTLVQVWTPALVEPGLSVEERLRIAITAYLEALERAPAFATCFFIEILAGGERLSAQRDEVIDEHVRILQQVIEASAVDDSSLAAPDLDVLRGVMGALGELISRAVRSQRGSGELRFGAVIEPFVQIFMAVTRAN